MSHYGTGDVKGVSLDQIHHFFNGRPLWWLSLYNEPFSRLSLAVFGSTTVLAVIHCQANVQPWSFLDYLIFMGPIYLWGGRSRSYTKQAKEIA